jgi:LysM repeat protein
MSRLPIPALLLAASASLAAGPPAPDTGGDIYTVARGDTLYSIARRYHSSVVEIARASGLADPTRIEIGQRLVVPGSDTPGAPAEPGKEEPAPAVAGLRYRFAPGDTLYSLARWARVPVGALIAANPGVDPAKVEIGDAVRLPAGAIAPEPARLREFGTGPGPAAARRPRPASLGAHDDHGPSGPPAPPPPRREHRHEGPRSEAPPAPTRGKPDDDGPAPEGM